MLRARIKARNGVFSAVGLLISSKMQILVTLVQAKTHNAGHHPRPNSTLHERPADGASGACRCYAARTSTYSMLEEGCGIGWPSSRSPSI